MRRDIGDRRPVVVRNRSLGQHTPVIAAALVWRARNHEPRVAGILLPGTVRVAVAHEDCSAVTIDIARIDARLQRAVRVRTIDRADESALH